MTYFVITAYTIGEELWLTLLPTFDLHTQIVKIKPNTQEAADLVAVTGLSWQQLTQTPALLEKETIYMRIQEDD